MRFTKDIIPKVLERNEGFEHRTYYKGRNSSEENICKITNGKMMRRSVGKTSWADSRYDKKTECDIPTTQRILRECRDRLDLNI